MAKNRSMAAKAAKAAKYAIENKKRFRAISDGAEAVMKNNPILCVWDEQIKKQKSEEEKKAEFMASLLNSWEEEEERAMNKLLSHLF